MELSGAATCWNEDDVAKPGVIKLWLSLEESPSGSVTLCVCPAAGQGSC